MQADMALQACGLYARKSHCTWAVCARTTMQGKHKHGVAALHLNEYLPTQQSMAVLPSAHAAPFATHWPACRLPACMHACMLSARSWALWLAAHQRPHGFCPCPVSIQLCVSVCGGCCLRHCCKVLWAGLPAFKGVQRPLGVTPLQRAWHRQPQCKVEQCPRSCAMWRLISRFQGCKPPCVAIALPPSPHVATHHCATTTGPNCCNKRAPSPETVVSMLITTCKLH